MRRTYSFIQVAMALMDDPLRQHWGYDLTKRSHVRSGVLYPILQRMLDEGLLTDGWEQAPADELKRPARRYYVLTDRGRQQLGASVAKAQQEDRFVPLFAPAVAR